MNALGTSDDRATFHHRPLDRPSPDPVAGLMTKRQEQPITNEAPADRAKREAREAHELERQEYLATLDPRQVDDLAMGDQ